MWADRVSDDAVVYKNIRSIIKECFMEEKKNFNLVEWLKGLRKDRKRKFDYFECLVNMSEFALKEARLLKDTFDNFGNVDMEAVRKEMHTLEHGCDIVKHSLAAALVKEFLPPIDREDLFLLGHVTDTLTDKIESVLIFFYMANITALRDDAKDFADMIISCCENVVDMLKEFKNFKKPEKIREYIVKINDLEEAGDKLYINAVRRLSLSETDTRTVIEWRDVYRSFEECCDAAEKIADEIESTIMKNS